ncbi:MAG: hypothetical protein ACLR8P_03690 [Clostridium fessum]
MQIKEMAKNVAMQVSRSETAVHQRQTKLMQITSQHEKEILMSSDQERSEGGCKAGEGYQGA